MPIIQLRSNGDGRSIDLLAVALDSDGKPLFGHDSVAYYGNRLITHNDVPVVSVSSNDELFKEIEENDSCTVDEQLVWNGNYDIAVIISCYKYQRKDEFKVLKNWAGNIRLIDDDGKLVSEFTIDDIGNLDNTTCMTILSSTKGPTTKSWFKKKRLAVVDTTAIKSNSLNLLLFNYGIINHSASNYTVKHPHK